MVSLRYAILGGMQCVPEALPIVRPATRPARVHWLPATDHWAAELKDWIAQGKQREALPWLVAYRREAWAQALLGEIRWKDEASSHKAFRWFRRAAPRSENQDPVVLRLAQCYEKGIGTSVNLFMAWHFYVRAAKALGVSDARIMQRHILPNAMVATLTFLPFILSGSVTVLASLDFLGFGLPPGSPSLGELVNQGKNNLNAPWLALTSFFVLGGMLTLLIFVGEAVRDAFDPRKTFA